MVLDGYEPCPVSPDCFTCPLARCVHDDPRPNQVVVRWLHTRADLETLGLVQGWVDQGITQTEAIDRVAVEQGLHRRTVWNRIQRAVKELARDDLLHLRTG